MTLEEKVDVTEQFTVVNAFNMPRLHYDAHRKTFIQYVAVIMMGLF